MFDMLGEEVFFEHNNSSPEDEEFDTIVGALEDILQDDGFQGLLNAFYTDNCGERRCMSCRIARSSILPSRFNFTNLTDKFEESKENKLEYTDVFDAYTTLVEKSLEEYLTKKIPVHA